MQIEAVFCVAPVVESEQQQAGGLRFSLALALGPGLSSQLYPLECI